MFIIASFASPEEVGTTVNSLLLMLPLAVAITVVYKAVKVPEITTEDFIKQVLATFCFGAVLLILIAVGLHVLTWLVTE